MCCHAKNDSLKQWNVPFLPASPQFKGQQTLPKRNELSDTNIDLHTSQFQTSLSSEGLTSDFEVPFADFKVKS
jgi:hypothetical protein